MRVIETTAEQARPWLVMADRFDASAGAAERPELERGCQFFAVQDEQGAEVGAFSTRLTDSTLWIVQAGGRAAGTSLAESVMPWVEQAARAAGLKSVAFATRRRGLVKRLEKRDFYATAVIVRKGIQ